MFKKLYICCIYAVNTLAMASPTPAIHCTLKHYLFKVVLIIYKLGKPDSMV
jgi:hypothetical protein